jgi:molybdopterin synthase catalytic subunit
MRAAITTAPIAPHDLVREVGSDEDGAVLLFLGTVRDHNDGRPVRGMRYEAYVAMAEQVLTAIVADAARRCGSDRIAAVHRIGELDVGDVSVAVAVATPHRAQAYDASRYIMEQIKVRLPVWKHEHYSDGEARWLDGHTPAVPNASGDG